MNLIEGVVEQVYVNEAKEGKFGTFYPQVLKVNGQYYNKNSNSNTPIAAKGDVVKFISETKTLSGGKEVHNISTAKGAFQVVSTGNAVEAAEETVSSASLTAVPVGTTATLPTESTTITTIKSAITATTRSIARQSSLKVAAELLLSDKTKDTFNPEELKQLTLQLEEFVLAPYNQQG